MSNALNRLLWWHILLIGAGASLILGLILYFAVIKPKNEDLGTVTADTKATQDAGGTPGEISKNQKKLDSAKKDTVKFTQEWSEYAQLYMPNINFSTDSKSPTDLLDMYERNFYTDGGRRYGLWQLPDVWGRWIANWYDGQARAGINRPPGMVFPLASFPTDPNAISKMSSISFPQDKPWHVTVVAKSFDQAMNHLKRFNAVYKHGMPVINNVTLAGQSPELQVDYDLMFYIIPPTAPPASDPILGAASSGGGGGNGPGGFGGGSMPGFGGGGPAGSFGPGGK